MAVWLQVKIRERGLSLQPRLYAGSVTQCRCSCSMWLVALYKYSLCFCLFLYVHCVLENQL